MNKLDKKYLEKLSYVGETLEQTRERILKIRSKKKKEERKNNTPLIHN